MEAVLRRERGVTWTAMRHLAVVVALAACPAPAKPPAPPIVKPPDAAVAPPPVESAVEPPEPTLRLPKNFVATGYEATLAIDPDKPAFDGRIRISGTIVQRSALIWLHGRHLAVSRAMATQNDVAVELDVAPHGDDLLALRPKTPLDAGAWTLELAYTGEIDPKNTTGAFVEQTGGARYVFTQFESIFARRTFPCIDEPDSKVPWQLALDVPDKLVALSNTPVERETALDGGRKHVAFARTPPLPSYLVAFAIGPFELVDAGATARGTPVRIAALAHRGAEAAWAAKTTARLVDLLEDWFGSPYPYAKLDMVAIPLTIGFGAMENAGLVTFTERAILIDVQRPSWASRYRWIRIASHELAHQWFGDLVTTAWWDDIWLNEGFANWMEEKITARFEPAWRHELAMLDMRDGALDADSLVAARKIRQPIETPDDILNAFDGITYNKGASVLAMFEAYVGAETFQRGVREYLKARAFGNATSADFVAAIGAAAGKDVAPAFATFLDQPGAPELDAKLACDRGGARVELAQQRYVPPGSPEPPAQAPWIVPACVVFDDGGKRGETCGVLDKPTGAIALATKSCPRWVMANANGRGYYRVARDSRQVTAMRDEAWAQLTWTERRAIDFDVVAAVRRPRRGREIPLQLGLSFAPRMLAGGDRFTIGDALALPRSLDRFVPDELRPKYEAWMRATFGPAAAKLGVVPKPGDDLDAERTRADLLHAAAWTGRDPDLVNAALAQAEHWRDLDPAVRGTILAIAVDASAELFARVLRDLKTEPDRARRDDMRGALAGVRDPKRQLAALELMFDPALDFREMFPMLQTYGNQRAREVAEQFYRDHAAEIAKRVPRDKASGWLTGMAWLFTAACDANRRDAVADYVTKELAPMPGGPRIVKQAIEAMDQCIAARAVIDPEVRAWLAGYRIPKPEPKAEKSPASTDKKPKKK
jgi:alanyl aminopeptidase